MNLFGDEPAEEPVVEEPSSAAIAEPLPSHPRYAQICLGHEKQEKEILKLYDAGKLPHALIFSGIRGIGKATFAYRVARFLLEHGGADDSQDSMFGPPEPPTTLEVSHTTTSGHLINACAHPDMLAIEREYDEAKDRYKDSVEVGAIRKVTPFLRKTSSEGGYRIVIIDDADTMNRSAQNGILKILEEPPKKTMILLVAHSVGRLIPTIRSRACVMNFHPLSTENMEKLLEARDQFLSEDKLSMIRTYAGGSIGEALNFIEEGGLEIFEKTTTLHDNFLSNPQSWDQVHKLAEQLSKPGQDVHYQQFTDVMLWLYKTMLTHKARAQNLPAFIETAPLLEYSQKSSLIELNERYDSLLKHFSRIKFSNLDKKQGVLGAFSLLHV